MGSGEWGELRLSGGGLAAFEVVCGFCLFSYGCAGGGIT